MKECSRRFVIFVNFSLNTFNFRYNCTPGQLNNERGGELHEIKGSQDKTEIDKEHDKE